MPDSYRPLRDDDPVGTEVHDARPGLDSCGNIKRPGPGKLLARGCGGDFCWVKWPNIYGPETWHANNLTVRVPDPWGELIERAKQSLCWFDDTTEGLAERAKLKSAIAAAEQAARP